jgi:hypothetical protein
MHYQLTKLGHIFTALVSMILASAHLLQAQRLVVSDPQHQARLSEVIQIPLNEVLKHTHNGRHFKAVNAATHKTLTTQIYADPNNPSRELLLIAVQLPASGELAIDFLPADDAQTEPPLVFGREAPERKDDFAWENQYVTYRVYGPALQATGEITSGIDVWSKRVPNFVIDSFYKRDAEGQRTHNPALSYHKDNGVGLDSYEVGKSRGCGGTGVLSGGKLWVSKNYTHLKLISSGPVRFQFELTYAPWDANGVEVTETKRITLDAGTHLNKIESTFIFAGPAVIDAAAGLALHAQADFRQLAHGRILSDWDTPQDPAAGKIATGIIAAPGQPATTSQLNDKALLVLPIPPLQTAFTTTQNGQALLVFPVKSGHTFTYYAGSGWSKADMPSQQAWDNYLTQTLAQLEHPLHIKWEGNAAPLSR